MLGERFGSFKAVARIGAGGMGEVFLAEHQRIDRRAAIKVLNLERTRDADAVRRFFTEAHATSLIRHPGIVEVYDCDVHRNGRAYIVMEYLEGQTLGGRLERRGALPWTTATVIARRVADAIGAAHEKAIIHRDLKPENVFLLSDADQPGPADVKVLDFGLAKLLGGGGALVGAVGTRDGSLLGSPAYMSPEQCEGAPADHRADVYALGCVLFEMIAGAPPFAAKGLRNLLAAHRFKTPPSLPSIVPQVPARLDRLVTAMLAKDAARRPATMAEVTAELDAIQAQAQAQTSQTQPSTDARADAGNAASSPATTARRAPPAPTQLRR